MLKERVADSMAANKSAVLVQRMEDFSPAISRAGLRVAPRRLHADRTVVARPRRPPRRRDRLHRQARRVVPGASHAARACRPRRPQPRQIKTRRRGVVPHRRRGTRRCCNIQSDDREALIALASRARVVLSTAGPYSICGTPLVSACVASGTDYVDINGEVPWVREMIHSFDAAAMENGTILVPNCGCAHKFDAPRHTHTDARLRDEGGI